MLVLTRKIGQKFIIGDNIMVTVLDTQRGQIRIGVEAPKKVTIYREEIFKKIMTQKYTNKKSSKDDK